MSENSKQTTSQSTVKRDRFVRIVESRVNKIISSLENLGKCSNKRNYEYNENDVRKIFREIDRKVKETKLQFQGGAKTKGTFKL
jgi:hypothetical protein